MQRALGQSKRLARLALQEGSAAHRLPRAYYRASLSKMGEPLLADDAAHAHPTLRELLRTLYDRSDFDARIHEHAATAVQVLRRVGPAHLNARERDAVDFELPKLERHTSAPVLKQTFERLMGVLPPRHVRDAAVFTYSAPLTQKLEHLSITLAIDRLRHTALGAMLLGDGRDAVHKPKQLLRALRASPFGGMARELGHELVKPMTGREAEALLFPHLNEGVVRELVADPVGSAARAERLYAQAVRAGAPLLLASQLPETLDQRVAYFRRS